VERAIELSVSRGHHLLASAHLLEAALPILPMKDALGVEGVQLIERLIDDELASAPRERNPGQRGRLTRELSIALAQAIDAAMPQLQSVLSIHSRGQWLSSCARRPRPDKTRF